MVESSTVRKINTIKIKTNASKVTADAGNVAPTDTVIKAINGGIDMRTIAPATAKAHMTA